MKAHLAALAAVSLLFAACQVPFGSTGSLRIQLPSPKALGSISANAGKGDLVRVQLTRAGVIVKLNGRDYLQQALSGQTMTLDGLPSGTGYRLSVATGELEGDFFEAAYFNTTGDLEISAGTETPVDLNLTKTPVTTLSAGAGAHASLALDDGSLYYINGNQITRDDGSPSQFLGSYRSLLSGSVVRSFGAGRDDAGNQELWINTSSGIYRKTSPTSVQGLTEQSPDVYQSIAFSDGVAGHILDVYQGKGLTAGVGLRDSGESPVFNSLEEVLGADDLPGNVRETLDKGNGLLTGFTVTESFAVLSTALGTYRVPTTLLDDGDTNALFDEITGPNSGYQLKATDRKGQTLSIGPVAAVLVDSSHSFVAGGTSQGLFYGSGDGDGAVDASWKLVASTYGLSVATVEMATFDGSVYTAFQDSKSGILVVLKDGAEILRLPSFAGLPSGSDHLSWVVRTGDSLKLAVSGDDATCLVDVATSSGT